MGSVSLACLAGAGFDDGLAAVAAATAAAADPRARLFGLGVLYR